jgi:hypothetical protein
MSKAAKRRAIVAKISAKVDRLRKEIEDRQAHLVHAKTRGNPSTIEKSEQAIAKAREALHAELKRLGPAIDRAEDAEMLERQEAAKRAAIRARNVALMRRLDALRDASVGIKKKWDEERRDEEKRIKKLKKKLEQRTRKDLTARPDWMKRPVALPPPIEQPDLTYDGADAPPPREGLIPGTYKVVDPDRLRFNLLDDDPLPPHWTARHVGKRLIEAHDVLRRLPMNVWPQGYSALWPEYVTEAGEAAVQAGAGTLAVGRNIIFKSASADEVDRMNEALTWPIQFLGGANFWALHTLNSWASSRDTTPDDECAPSDLLDFIAAALNAAREPVK